MIGQNSKLIIGSWKWVVSNYEGTAYFDDTEYKMQLNIMGTESRISEIFRYYKVENGKVLFAIKPFETAMKSNKITEYLLKEINNEKMILIDSKGNEDTYERISLEKPTINKIRINEFDASSGAPMCITDKKADGYLPCLCFGNIDFSTSLSKIESIYGNPYRTIENDEGSKTKVYLLKTDGESYPYFAITFNKNSITSIQLTGIRLLEEISFSSIRLGDHHSFVEQKLGLPSSKHDVQEIQGEMWDYRPFPITIEFKDDLVYSIRLTRK